MTPGRWPYITCAAVALTVGCTDGVASADPDGEEANAAVGIEVTVTPELISPGGTATATAKVVDQNGSPVAGRGITWEVADAGVASIDQTGQVVGKQQGLTQVVARSAELSGAAALRVGPPRAGSIELSTAKSDLVANSTTRVVAVVRDVGGGVMPEFPVSWSSSRPTFASVDADGVVTSHGAGTVYIKAAAGGAKDSIPIRSAALGINRVRIPRGHGSVLGLGRQAFPWVLLEDAAGNLIANLPTVFTSSNPEVVAVDGFILNAVGLGTTIISSGYNGHADSYLLEVVADPQVHTVMMGQEQATIRVGEALVVPTEVRTASGVRLTDRSNHDWIQDWFWSLAAVIRTSGDSLIFVPTVEGIYTIEREVENRRGTVVITVLPAVRSVCSEITGATLYGDDGQYIGHLVASPDPRSVRNPSGLYGSLFSSTSLVNAWSPYGSGFSEFSAFNPLASRPPVVVRDGVVVGRLTINTAIPEAIHTGLALACAFH